MILSAVGSFRVEQSEVVQDFGNGTTPNMFTTPDANIKLGVEG